MTMPSKAHWLSIAHAVAAERHMHVRWVIGRSRKMRHIKARWAAWERLLGDGSRYSISGIAKRVGVDHSTIIHARKNGFVPRYADRDPNKSDSRGPCEVAHALLDFNARI